MDPQVTPLSEEPGLWLYEPIRTTRFVLYTDRPVEPRPADDETFDVPVGTAVSIEASELVVPEQALVHVLSADQQFLDTIHPRVGNRHRADADRLLDVISAAMKLYVAVPGPCEVASEAGQRETVISLPEPGEIVVGVRSYREQPVGTIETPAEPEPVMRALSASGAALKTLSPERSCPTLRGHPPAFEAADELSIPSTIDPPETDLTVRVPAEWAYVYPVAPLAFYLGARLRPGDPPRIEGEGWSYRLAGEDPQSFGTSVLRALQQVFFVESVARTEGRYPVDLHERRALRESVDLDVAALYAAAPERRIREVLDLPYEAVADHLPTWHLCVDVEPTADGVAALPHLLDEMAAIRCPGRRQPIEHDPAVDAALDAFVRSDGPGAGRGNAPPTDSNAVAEAFSLPSAPAMEQAYLGEGLPVARNKLTLETLRRRLEYDRPTADGIGVRIVCNDEEMAEEAAVEEYYGVHDVVQHSVDVAYDLTRAELAEVLRDDVDLLHYVGHMEAEGFTCADGHLDARTLSDVGVDAFLLNACNSYDQGRALLDAGARAGVTSLTVVNDREATRLGRTMARALDAGFTLRSALSLAGIDAGTRHYVVLGDGGRQLAQCQTGVPFLADVVGADLDAGTATVDLFAFPAGGYGQGATCVPEPSGRTDQHLAFGHLDRFELGIEAFADLAARPGPVAVDGVLHWSEELDREAATELLASVESGRGPPTPVGEFLQPVSVLE